MSLTYSSKALESNGASHEGLTVVHAESLLEDSAVSVGVDLESHTNGVLVTVLNPLEWLICDDSLAILHEDCLVSGCLDRSAGRPAELVTQWVISLLSDGDTTAEGLVRNNFPVALASLINDLHGSHDIDAGVKTTLI